MKKWRIDFSGFAYVEAETQEEAADKFGVDDVVYCETNHDAIHEVDEFEVEI